MSILIRAAAHADKDFIINAIIEAEKSGSNTIGYCSIFSISESELRDILASALEEEIEGQELYIPGFLIAEAEGMPAAACCAWVEKETGTASSMLKSTLLLYFMDRVKLREAEPALAMMNEITIEREDGALQIECVYTHAAYRGRGLSRMLIERHIELALLAGKMISKMQVQLMSNNYNAINSYKKAGFSTVKERTASNKAILHLLPGDSKTLMEREI